SIAVDIDQDHPQKPFDALLRGLLLKQDVTELDAEQPDITIEGKVMCNGYSDVYYSAEILCRSRNGTICSISERPPSGDRQANLALEVVSKLGNELQKLVGRNERRRALRELGE